VRAVVEPLERRRRAASRRQWKDDGSSAENAKVAERLFVSAAGADATTAVGERVSTLHV
jgi:hypothetical protein